jgi:hypothetical protein
MKHVRVRAVPLFAVLSVAVVVFAFSKATNETGVFSFWSFLVFVGSIAFMLLSLAGLALAVSVPRKEIHRWARIHSLLVSIACCVVLLFFSAWHLIGLRLWAP